MPETYLKKDSETLEITSTKEEKVERTLVNLRADLAQAEVSLAQIKKDNAKREADTQATIDLFKQRIKEAGLLGIA